jgi:hypothetical protein
MTFHLGYCAICKSQSQKVVVPLHGDQGGPSVCQGYRPALRRRPCSACVPFARAEVGTVDKTGNISVLVAEHAFAPKTRLSIDG